MNENEWLFQVEHGLMLLSVKYQLDSNIVPFDLFCSHCLQAFKCFRRRDYSNENVHCYLCKNILYKSPFHVLGDEMCPNFDLSICGIGCISKPTITCHS